MRMSNELCYFDNIWIDMDVCSECWDCCDSLAWIGSFARADDSGTFNPDVTMSAASEYYYTLTPKYEDKNGTLS